MNIVIINSILRTAEKGVIPQAKSIKDSLLYNYALAFHNLGHHVTLIAAKDYMPTEPEEYPYPILFLESSLKWLFKPDLIPLHLELFKYLLHNKNNIDLVISSEVFQLNSLIAALCVNKKKIVFWQEMSSHQKKFFRLPSLIWYSFIVRVFLKDIFVVARSERAYFFIKKYFKHVSKEIVRNGVTLEKFTANVKKEDYVISVSRLIARKNVNSIIRKFDKFIKSSKDFFHYKLLVVGEGEELNNLISLVDNLGIRDSVVFCGQMAHNDLNNTLGKAKCFLIDSVRDLAIMVVAESIATATPILSNTIIDNSLLINEYNLGVAKEDWTHLELITIINNNEEYVNNCAKYRDKLSFDYYAQLMLDAFNKEK